MKLTAYLAKTGQTASGFSRKIGVSHVSVLRYMEGARIPRPDVMSKIERESAGEVQPNDFFPSSTEEAA